MVGFCSMSIDTCNNILDLGISVEFLSASSSSLHALLPLPQRYLVLVKREKEKVQCCVRCCRCCLLSLFTAHVSDCRPKKKERRNMGGGRGAWHWLNQIPAYCRKTNSSRGRFRTARLHISLSCPVLSRTWGPQEKKALLVTSSNLAGTSPFWLEAPPSACSRDT